MSHYMYKFNCLKVICWVVFVSLHHCLRRKHAHKLEDKKICYGVGNSNVQFLFIFCLQVNLIKVKYHIQPFLSLPQLSTFVLKLLTVTFTARYL